MEGDNECPEIIANFCISIHSLRMEGDVYMTIIYYNYIYFNPLPPHGGRPCKYTNSSNEIAISIHSLRMEGDAVARKENFSINRFQSTPSAWRETESRGVLSVSERFQSTPSAWRETFRLRTSLDHQHISIHSLRMEGDIHRTNHGRRRIISIHSLRMEGDHLRQADTVHVVYFNPLPPHGGRLKRGYYFRSD